MLRSFPIIVSDHTKDLSYHSKTVDLLYVINLTAEELICKRRDLEHLFSAIRVVVYSTSVGKSIMHRKLLFQVTYLFFKPLNSKVWINNRVDGSLIFDFHHSGGKFKRRDCFFEMLTCALDVGNHYRFAIAA